MTYIIGGRHQKLDWRRDGLKPFVSRKYLDPNTGFVTHDLKCDICGKWYNYSTKDIYQISREGRWNKSKGRPYHCNSAHCQDYHARSQRHLWNMAVNIAKEAYPHAFMEQKRI